MKELFGKVKHMRDLGCEMIGHPEATPVHIAAGVEAIQRSRELATGMREQLHLMMPMVSGSFRLETIAHNLQEKIKHFLSTKQD